MRGYFPKRLAGLGLAHARGTDPSVHRYYSLATPARAPTETERSLRPTGAANCALTTSRAVEIVRAASQARAKDTSQGPFFSLAQSETGASSSDHVEKAEPCLLASVVAEFFPCCVATFILLSTFLLAVLAATTSALQPLGYPEGPLTADQIAQQVYAAAHGGLVRNAVSKGDKGTVALVVNRAPPDSAPQGRKPTVQTFDSYVNSNPANPAIESLQMAILTSGQAKGTGILFTSFTDRQKEATIAMWLPALRRSARSMSRTMKTPGSERT